MLNNSCILRSQYDERNDVLYLHFTASPRRAYGDVDPYENVILLREIETNQIVGVTLLYPKAEQEKREKELSALGYQFDLSRLLH